MGRRADGERGDGQTGTRRNAEAKVYFFISLSKCSLSNVTNVYGLAPVPHSSHTPSKSLFPEPPFALNLVAFQIGATVPTKHSTRLVLKLTSGGITIRSKRFDDPIMLILGRVLETRIECTSTHTRTHARTRAHAHHHHHTHKNT